MSDSREPTPVPHEQTKSGRLKNKGAVLRNSLNAGLLMMAATVPGDRLSSAPVTSAVNSPEPRVIATFPIDVRTIEVSPEEAAHSALQILQQNIHPKHFSENGLKNLMLKLEKSDNTTLKGLVTESKSEWIHVPEAKTPNSTEIKWTVGFDPAGVEPRVAFELSQHTTATDTVTEVTTAIDQKGSLMPWRKNDGWVGEDYNPVNQNGWIDSAKDLFNLPETQPRDWQETDSIVEGHRIAIGRDYQSGRTEYEVNLSRLRGGEDVEKEIHPDASLVTLITHTTTK